MVRSKSLPTGNMRFENVEFSEIYILTVRSGGILFHANADRKITLLNKIMLNG